MEPDYINCWQYKLFSNDRYVGDFILKLYNEDFNIDIIEKFMWLYAIVLNQSCKKK